MNKNISWLFNTIINTDQDEKQTNMPIWVENVTTCFNENFCSIRLTC